VLKQGLSPTDAAREMSVPPGFHVVNSAAEPDVMQPIAMTIDDRGRLWVAESYSYPVRVAKDEDAKDRIVIFEDTNLDGVFDKHTVFMDNLNLISGLEVGFGGVWIGAAPNFMFVADANQDDVPDGKPQILLDGWHYEDTHETLNSFIWGPDGWLYGCHGVFTHSRVGKPGTPDAERTPINAGIWRYHPTDHQFEVFAQGTSNPWGVDFNDKGQSFLTCCVIPHLFHVIQGARYERQAGTHFNPFTYDDIKTIANHRHWTGGQWNNSDRTKSNDIGGGHAHAGAMIYLGGTWPEKYRNKLFMNNIHGARLNMDILTTRDSGYVGDYAPDFLKANDVWSQIIYLRSGPDGNMFMIDWYDKNQCHHRDVPGHDRSNGRIFKVSYGEQTAQMPMTPEALNQKGVRSLSDAELVACLEHKNDWWVRTARRVLQERAAVNQLQPETKSQLLEMATHHSETDRRLRAMWALHGVRGIDDTVTLALLEDADPYVRSWAIQLSTIQYHVVNLNVYKKLCEMAQHDPSPVVRLYLTAAVQRLSGSVRWDLLAALLAHDEDVSDHNLPLMHWYALEPLIDFDGPRALKLAVDGKFPRVLEFTCRKMAELKKPDYLEAMIQAVSAAKTPETQLTMIRGIRAGLSGLRKVPAPQGWSEVFQKLFASKQGELSLQALGLAVTFNDPVAIKYLHEVVADPKQLLAKRQSALTDLVSVEYPGLAQLLIDELPDADLKNDVLRAMASVNHETIPGLLLKNYDTFSPDQKRLALNVLCSRVNYARILLANMGSETEQVIKNSDLSADLVRQLGQLQDAQLREMINKTWGSLKETPAEKAEQIRNLTAYLLRTKNPKPDLEQGRAIFAKTCQQCHTLFDAGGKIGPELTGSNRANIDYLLSNIIDPSAVMSKEYIPVTILTSAGRAITGIIKEQNANAITLVNANETVVIPRDEILEQKNSEQSMMPDNILKNYKEHEIRDLVNYLAQTKQTSMLATNDNALSFLTGHNLDLWSGDREHFQGESGQLLAKTDAANLVVELESQMALQKFKLNFDAPDFLSAGQFRLSLIDSNKRKESFWSMTINAAGEIRVNGRHQTEVTFKLPTKGDQAPATPHNLQIIRHGNLIQVFSGKQVISQCDIADLPARMACQIQIATLKPTEVRLSGLKLMVE
jgi:putative membrane-bound dehydrogenase-like protein